MSVALIIAAIHAEFPLYWNVQQVKEPPIDVTRFGYRPRNSTQVGNGCAADPPPHANANCKPWTQGLFPTIDDNGTFINGGVPQAANLGVHLHAIEATLPGWIPDKDWEGNAVLDFEAWTNVWELNSSPSWWHGRRYQDASRELIRRDHPDWNATTIEAAAKHQWETAATAWMAQTLRKCREMRPRARWGFYGLPQGVHGNCVGTGAKMHCGFDGPNSTANRNMAEVTQLPVWQASSGLFPSIYLAHSLKGDPDQIRAWIYSTVGEASRCAHLAAPAGSQPLPIFPYAWDHFHSPPTPPVRVPKELVIAQLQHSADSGASGVVLWGNPTYSDPGHEAEYWAWLKSESGPAVRSWCAQRAGGC